MNQLLASKKTKVIVFIASLIPLFFLLWWAYQGALTANPIQFVTHDTGDWTIRFLMISLAITPLRRLTNWSNLIKFRRMLGLFAFFYAFLHFIVTYLILDQFFDWVAIGKDIVKRPYITVGFTGFVLLVPLAITSTTGWIRRMGGKRWQRLHRAVYFIALAGVIHYYWLVKSDIRGPLLYASILLVLMVFRAVMWMQKKRPVQKPQPATAVRA